jgi:pimeloyl-ACP methyl ester carboxylesterase
MSEEKSSSHPRQAHPADQLLMPINYVLIGEGYPVVMLPGWTLDHHVMLGAMEPVFGKRSGWNRIYVDLPGTGRSEPQQSIHNSDDMCAAVLEFLDDLIPKEPFIVCGYSYGALIARGMAHLRRNFVRGLFLFAPVVVAEPTERVVPAQRILKKDPLLIARLSPEEAADYESTAVLQGQSEWERYRDEVLGSSWSTNHEYLERVRENGYGFSFDVDVHNASFEHPALIITGRQDHVVGFEDAWTLIDKLSTSNLCRARQGRACPPDRAARCLRGVDKRLARQTGARDQVAD